MAEEVAKDQNTEIVLNIYDLPKTITLRLPNGESKVYTMNFAPKTSGLYLNKAM
jgi:hypothetical protein